jgi:hypothetical protein
MRRTPDRPSRLRSGEGGGGAVLLAALPFCLALFALMLRLFAATEVDLELRSADPRSVLPLEASRVGVPVSLQLPAASAPPLFGVEAGLAGYSSPALEQSNASKVSAACGRRRPVSSPDAHAAPRS